MCLEDVRLGREKFSRLELVAVPALTNTVIAASDPSRTAIIISPVDGSVIWISDKVMTADATGIRVQPNSAEAKDLLVEDHGDFVSNQINAWSTAGCTVAVLTTSLSRK